MKLNVQVFVDFIIKIYLHVLRGIDIFKISVGTYEEHKIGVLVYKNNILTLNGYLEGHSDPILKIK